MSETHAETVAYVRDEMLPAQMPPVQSAGAINWVRQNMLSSWLNIILTLIGLFIIYEFLAAFIPWIAHSIWNADSLAQCREIRDQIWGPDATMACFAVLTDRWDQLLFGFYPSHLYWRPLLALALFFVALSPVLFERVPRRMFWFTVASPFILYWLLWGGSAWGILTVAFGLAVAALIYRAIEPRSGLLAILAAVGLFFFYIAILQPILLNWGQSIAPLYIERVKSDQFGGFLLAIIIGASGIILSLPVGILLALGRQSHLFFIKIICVAFIEIIRGVPLIVWLFTASMILNYFLPPTMGFDLMLRVIIMVTLFSSAYIAEVVRGGLAALPSGQYEAAQALGLDYAKSMRLIILPQALKISIPGIVNTFIGLFKDTTLVVYIGMFDPIGLSNSIRAHSDWNGIYWEILIFIALIFFVFCFSMGRYSLFLEKKLQHEHS